VEVEDHDSSGRRGWGGNEIASESVMAQVGAGRRWAMGTAEGVCLYGGGARGGGRKSEGGERVKDIT
jgi:hypothetical protein